jgi:hypothetical protein
MNSPTPADMLAFARHILARLNTSMSLSEVKIELARQLIELRKAPII